jgi:hypothetical protein
MKTMAALDADFTKYVDESLKIIASTEVLWLTAPPASVVRKQLKVPQLEALYEAVYLRVFSAWESFVEDVLVRFMSGYETSTYAPVLTPGWQHPRTVKDARTALYGTRPYVLWHNPASSANRISRYMSGSPLEATLRSQQARLEIFAAIRHRIAHDSDDARTNFKMAAMSLAGSQYDGHPGRLLRAPDLSDPLNQSKWILRISTNLTAAAHLILKLPHLPRAP